MAYLKSSFNPISVPSSVPNDPAAKQPPGKVISDITPLESTPLLGYVPTKKKKSGLKAVRRNYDENEGYEYDSRRIAEFKERLVSGREKRPHPRRFRSIPHSAPPKPRYVTSVCTAKEYSMPKLKAYFQSMGFPVVDSTEVLFTRYEVSSPDKEDEPAEVFFFQYGVAVWWGPSDSWGKLMVLSILKNFEIKSESTIDLEVCDYSYHTDGREPASNDEDTTEMREDDSGSEKARRPRFKSTIWNDHFILADHNWETKLAFSHGLAQSAKLTVFEERIDRVIDETRRYPEYLAENGKVKLTRNEIAKLKGRLFLHRMDINLHSDILDTPDFFWEHTELEPLYMGCRNYMEINKRVEILNQRLDVVHELFTMLSDELNQKHSAKLEWIIIWLIVMEVIVGIVSIALTVLGPNPIKV